MQSHSLPLTGSSSYQQMRYFGQIQDKRCILHGLSDCQWKLRFVFPECLGLNQRIHGYGSSICIWNLDNNSRAERIYFRYTSTQHTKRQGKFCFKTFDFRKLIPGKKRYLITCYGRTDYSFDPGNFYS